MKDSSIINTVLGIDPDIDIYSFDPIANKGDGGVNDYLYVLGNRLTVFALSLQNAVNEIQSSTDSTQDYFKAISEEIEKEYTRTKFKVDITDTNFIWAVIDNITAAKNLTYSDDMQDDYIQSGIFAVLPVIEIKSTSELTTAVIRFSLSKLQENIRILAMGGQAASNLDQLMFSDILDYIAKDQDINADDITPNIIAVDDAVSTDEDTFIDIFTIQNDNYLNSAPITITAGIANNGTTEVRDCCNIRYTPSNDFNGTDSFNYTLLQGGKASSAKVSITVNPVNDSPSIDIASTISVAENQTSVATISISDPDSSDVLSLTLGGTDASSFNLSTLNVVTFKIAPDYETKNSYSLILSLTDGIETVTKNITINITNINDIAPVISSSASFSAAENQTAVGTVTAADAEGDALSYSVSGSELAISLSGVLTFKVAPDYETKTSYIATVTINDGVNNTTQAITVSVTNVNEAPKITGNSEFNINEDISGLCSGSDLYGGGSCEVFYITATDPDNDNLAYSISGTDKNGFQVNSAGKVSTTFGPNYENALDADANNIYEFTINVSDGLLSTSKDIKVNVINTDEPPVLNWGSERVYVDENQISIKKIEASDPENDDISISIDGEDFNLINLGNDNTLTFKNAPDYESKKLYSFNINLVANGLTESRPITVEVVNRREGLIDWTYKITNGIDDVAPRLQATAQFDDLLSVDKVIFRLRMNHEFNNHGIVSFTATKTATNTWTIDEPLSPKLNPAHPYYVNIFYESGSNGSNFANITSRPKEGSNWQFISATNLAEQVGALTLEDSLRLDSKSNLAYLKFTNTNANVDTTAPSLESYLSVSDSTSYIANQSDAITISGNDGDINNPITISFRMLFDEKILYATDRGTSYTPSGSSTIYNTAQTAINGREVTYTYTLSAKTGSYRIRPYIFVYDEALNRTRIRLDNIYITNSITDIDHPGISSIQFDTSVGSDKEKYIDYDIQLEDPEELTRLSKTFRGPQCELIYGSFHDYNIDSSLNPGQYKGKFRLLDNQVDGIYAISSSDLYAYDVDNNRLRINTETLEDTFSVVPMILDADPNQANNLYCPMFTVKNSTIYFNENSTDPVASYENTIHDPYGNIITPKFSLMDPDATLFNISDTGVVTFKSPPDYENPLDEGGNNSYEVGVKIYNTNGDSSYIADNNHWSADTFTIRVEDIEDDSSGTNLATWEEYEGPILTNDNLLFDDSLQSGHNFVVYVNNALAGITSVTMSGPDAGWLSASSSGNGIYLTFLKDPDCGVKTSLNITLTISNGTTSLSQDITIYFNKTYLSTCEVPALYWQSEGVPRWYEINKYFYETSGFISSGSTLANDFLEKFKNAISADGANITYSISGEDSYRFIAAESSVGNFCDGCNDNYADYEYKSSYKLAVTANDGTNTISRDIQINLDNRNDNLTVFTSPNTYQFSGANQKIGTIAFSDQDWPSNIPGVLGGCPLGCYSFYIENENDAASFYLDGNDLYFAGTPTKGGYSIKLIVDSVYPYYTSSGNTADDYNIRYAIHNLSIDNTDINSAPTITSSGTISADENQTSIGTVVGNDYESSSLTYTLSGSNAADLEISSVGVLSFKTAPDYEIKKLYTATVSVSDGVNTIDQSLIININNKLEDILAYSFAISDGTNSVAPKLTSSLTLDRMTLAKKVYAQIISVATSSCSEDGATETFEMSKVIQDSDATYPNATLWSVSEDLFYGLTETCRYQIKYFINPYDITSEQAPPVEGFHLRSANKALSSLGTSASGTLQHTFLYSPLDSLNTVEINNSRSDNSFDVSLNPEAGQSIFLYNASGSYPSTCNSSTYVSDSGHTSPIVAKLEKACFNSMLLNTSSDSAKVKYEFSIYSLEELNNSRIRWYFAIKDSQRSSSSIIQDPYGDSGREFELIAGNISGNHIASFIFEFSKQALTTLPDVHYIFIYADAKSLSRKVIALRGIYVPDTSTSSDISAPIINSISMESYRDRYVTGGPIRDYLKVTADITNDSHNGGTVTSIRDFWVALRAPDCSFPTIYVRDELDGQIATNTSSIQATIPILKNMLGTYQIRYFNINDWGFAESFYDKQAPENYVKTHPNIGDKITIGDGTDVTCPLFSEDSSLIIDINENTTALGTYPASGSNGDTIQYSIEKSNAGINDYGDTDCYCALEYKFYEKLSINSLTGELTINEPLDTEKILTGWVNIIAQSSLNPELKNILALEIRIKEVNE